MQNKDRKFAILYAIIKDYIQSAEPVGSRTIEKNHNLGISSATIRNEMADLEEMGYLIQPHKSAGRIPSDKAYRIYVDEFMQISEQDEQISEAVKNHYRKYLGELNASVRKAAEILTKLTNYTSLVMMPNMTVLGIKDIRLIHIEDERVLLVLITLQGIVRNAELKLSKKVTASQTEKITNFLNVFANRMDTETFMDRFADKIDELDHEEQLILSEIVPAIKQVLQQDSVHEIYASGMTEILNFPEFQDMDKARQIMKTLHKQELLANLLQSAMDNNFNIKIGNENDLDELSECSILTATYKLNGHSIGTIGIVGPTRMNYDHCVSALNILSQELTNHISNTTRRRSD